MGYDGPTERAGGVGGAVFGLVSICFLHVSPPHNHQRPPREVSVTAARTREVRRV